VGEKGDGKMFKNSMKWGSLKIWEQAFSPYSLWVGVGRQVQWFSPGFLRLPQWIKEKPD
jgi:hypothetical protein